MYEEKMGRLTRPRVHATAPRVGNGRSAPTPRFRAPRVGDGHSAPTPRF